MVALHTRAPVSLISPWALGPEQPKHLLTPGVLCSLLVLKAFEDTVFWGGSSKPDHRETLFEGVSMIARKPPEEVLVAYLLQGLLLFYSSSSLHLVHRGPRQEARSGWGLESLR